MSNPSLFEFLSEAELGHYYNALRDELRVTCVEHLKYVREEDLDTIRMTRPEMRRLRKYYKRENPHGAFSKLRKVIMRSASVDTQAHPVGSGLTDRGAVIGSSNISHSIPSRRSQSRHEQMIPADDVSVGKQLGRGQFGVVHQAVWSNGDGQQVAVAVRVMTSSLMPNGRVDDFVKEAGRLLIHHHIVKVFGVVHDDRSSLVTMVLELAPLGSLSECLKDVSLRFDLSVWHLCTFAEQVSDAMNYLESISIVHRGLSARNVLLFTKTKVKVSDVALTAALGMDREYYQYGGGADGQQHPPISWCAPECFSDLLFTSASDVWAFGVTLWEMFSYGQFPWAGLSPQQIMDAVNKPQYVRLSRPPLCPTDHFMLMERCWEYERHRRPTFKQLSLTLPQIRPEKVRAVRRCLVSTGTTVGDDYLPCLPLDVIVVLDKSPCDAPRAGLWSGCLADGRVGYVDPSDTTPCTERVVNPAARPPLVRRESCRTSRRSKLRVDMIGAPERDFRHTGHIGYDGVVFGDLSFLSDNYDKFPPGSSHTAALPSDTSRGSSSVSNTSLGCMSDMNGFIKPSFVDARLSRINGCGNTWISQESLTSVDSQPMTEDDSIFADFKMPDLSASFDFGPSFMDEVLKALDEKEKEVELASSARCGAACHLPISDHTDIDVSRDVNGSNVVDKTPLVEEKCFNPILEKRSPPPLPCQPPRSESFRRFSEKKHAKVKPMSASEAKMMEEAIMLANEVTATHAMQHSASQSPPKCPSSVSDDAVFSGADQWSAAPNLFFKLKNSIRRSPKAEHKRTFCEDWASRDVEEETPPSAQEAYSALVDKRDVDSGQAINCDVVQSNNAVFTDGVSGASSSFCASQSSCGLPTVLWPKPMVCTDFARKSDLPVPKPRSEIVQRVEPTLRQPETLPVCGGSQSDVKEQCISSKRSDEMICLDPPNEAGLLLSKCPNVTNGESIQDEDSDSTRLSSASDCTEPSISKVAVSLFDNDITEPTPREVMSRLARERRMKRNLDHQRALSGQDRGASLVIGARTTCDLTAGPVGRDPLSGRNEGEAGDLGDDVDTNPLRMLRGGAIPIRSSRGAGRRHMLKR